jgi:hypothetical protein
LVTLASALQRAGALAVSQPAAGSPTVGSALDDIFHKVAATVMGALIVGIGGTFLRMQVLSARHEERHDALKSRVDGIDNAVQSIPTAVAQAISQAVAPLQGQLTDIRASVEDSARNTQRDVQRLSETVGFLRGVVSKNEHGS